MSDIASTEAEEQSEDSGRRRLVFATGNRHKVQELGQIVRHCAFDVVTSAAIDPDAPEVEETGQTFEENAALKAIAAFTRTGEWSIADDSGICVSALGDAPGISSARFAGPACDDQANNLKLLASLDGVEDRRAHYICVIALVAPVEFETGPKCSMDIHRHWPGLPEHATLAFARGRVDGLITHAAAGDGGFGYDPYFFVPSLSRTFAEATADEKHAISHRGEATRTLVQFLESQGGH